MNVTLENPVRLVALLAICAVAGAGALVLRMSGGGDTEATSAPVTPVNEARAAAPKAKAPARKPAASRSPIAPNGLPRTVAAALREHKVVVVSVVAPGARIDDLAVREARAGAKDVNAGFVQVNAYRQREIAPFEAKVVFRTSPAVVVMTRPDTVFARFDGFADRTTVAQAAENARKP